MMDKHLLCLCLLFIALCRAEDTKEDVRRKEDSGPMKNTRLFARLKISPPQGSQIPKLRMEATAHCCSRLMESCSAHLPCCDPCASCHCRLFNTICYCWRMSPHCSKRT
ncbi:hypothetical protein LDENG_00124520 [Lucifuga dentata]|nr:hypothetical protein LDENG_00124520 [Lucifuga dentata]